MKKLEIGQIKTPTALAALGAFFTPEPLGTCIVLIAAVWWSCRRLIGRTSQLTASTLTSTAECEGPPDGYKTGNGLIECANVPEGTSVAD